ncbi:MAG TPA: DUF177 domain-containing protein [Thermohalobaculum sp.]|nr:DUF177 domain-containing protein [Thermohalobaculum sp.]
MDTKISTTEHSAPFQRPMVVARIRRDVETPFRISADAGELKALARYLNVDRIDRLSLAGFISATGKVGWRVRGRLVAKLEQSCVVSMAPVPSRHDVEVERRYLPAGHILPEHEVLVTVDDEDTPDPFIHSIDLAQLAIESLVLMIDPYPRAAGAELGEINVSPPGVAPLTGDANQPFASLAILKGGPTQGDG